MKVMMMMMMLLLMADLGACFKIYTIIRRD